MSVSQTDGVTPLSVAFDGAGSHDPDGDAIAGYTFDFGDNSPLVSQASPTISHTYEAAGTFQASLTVTDSQGQVSAPVSVAITVTATITVTPPGGPVAAFTLSPTRGPAPLLVTFDASRSFDRGGGSIAEYTLDFGDGNTLVQTTAGFTHTYLAPGTYTPKLTVKNQAGQVSPTPATAKVEATGPSGGSKGGGALGVLTLLPLLGIGLARRRRH